MIWELNIFDALIKDYTGFFGSLITIAGFILTITLLLRTKSAAEAARTSALDTYKRLSFVDVANELSAAIEIAEEIRRLFTLKSYPILPDRLSILRRKIVKIKNLDLEVVKKHTKKLQIGIAEIAWMEKTISKCLIEGNSPDASHYLVDLIIEQSALFQSIQGQIVNFEFAKEV